LKKSENKVLRAVIYARFSSELQRNESIDAQVRAITEYAGRNNMKIVGEYIDKAKSATTDKRPEFQHMISDAKHKKFDVVLVHKLDRFARNRNDSMIYRTELRRHNVRLISILEYIDENSPESIITESMLEAFAEYYSKNLAREVEKGKKENALKGLHVGGVPPLGYDVDKATKKLILNESETKAVKLIYSMFLDGCGYTEIIDELRLRGYKTKRDEDFRKNSLFSILKNEKYTGIYIYNRSASKDVDGKRNGHKYKDDDEIIRIENGQPQIISKEDFNLVQEKMLVRKKKAASNTADEIYILSGKVECGVCGATYAGNSRHTEWKHRQYVDYRCNKRGGKVKCINKGIRRETLESFVLDRLSDFIFSDEQIPYIVANYNKYILSKDSELISQMEELKDHLKEIEKDINSIVALLVKTSSDALLDRLSELEEQKKDITKRYNKLVDDTDIPQIDSKQIKEVFKQARKLLKDGQLTTIKRLIERYVNKVVVYPDHIYVEFNLGLDINLDIKKEIPQNTPADQSDDSMVNLNPYDTQNLCALHVYKNGF